MFYENVSIVMIGLLTGLLTGGMAYMVVLARRIFQ